MNVKQTTDFNAAGKDKDEDAGAGQADTGKNTIHLYFQKRNARKCLTLVQGMPDDLDLDKIARTFKKRWHCNGNTLFSDKWGEIIQL